MACWKYDFRVQIILGQRKLVIRALEEINCDSMLDCLFCQVTSALPNIRFSELFIQKLAHTVLFSCA